MQTLATLSKSTKQGISTFYFVETDDNSYAMFGGIKPRCIAFDTIEDLRKAYVTWCNYGFMPAALKSKTKAYISNPWESNLPVHLQHELEELSL